MKKILRLVTTSVLTLTLVACGEASSSVSTSGTQTSSSVPNVSSAYANVTSVTLSAATATLTQVMGAQRRVTVTAALNANTNPNLSLEWFVNGVKQAQTSRIFDFTPTEVGSFAIQARIGNLSSNTLNVTLSLPQFAITSAEFIGASLIEIKAPSGAEVSVVGATLEDSSYYDLKRGLYVLNLKEVVAQGNQVTVRLVKDGFAPLTQAVVLDTRKFEVENVKLANYSGQSTSTVNENLLPVNGAYQIVKPFDEGAVFVKTYTINFNTLNFFNGVASKELRIVNTVPTGAAAMPSSIESVVSLTSKSFEVKKDTAPGLYTHSITLDGKLVEVKVQVLDPKPEIVLEKSFNNEPDLKDPISGDNLNYEVQFNSKPLAVAADGAYLLVKPFATVTPAASDNNQLKFNFIARNFLSQEFINNQYRVALSGPTSLGNVGALFTGIEVDNATNQTANQTNLETNNSYEDFNGSFSTTFGALKTSALGNVIQFVDRSTPVGDYVFTITAGIAGSEISRNVTVRVQEPTAELEFHLLQSTADASGNGAVSTNLVRTNVITKTGDSYVIEKPLDTSVNKVAWAVTLKNYQSQLVTDSLLITNDLLEADPSKRQFITNTSGFFNENTVLLRPELAYSTAIAINNVDWTVVTGQTLSAGTHYTIAKLAGQATTLTTTIAVTTELPASATGATDVAVAMNFGTITPSAQAVEGDMVQFVVKRYTNTTWASATLVAQATITFKVSSIAEFGSRAEFAPTDFESNAYRLVSYGMSVNGPSTTLIPPVLERKAAIFMGEAALASTWSDTVVLFEQNNPTNTGLTIDQAFFDLNNLKYRLDTAGYSLLHEVLTTDNLGYRRNQLNIDENTPAGTYTLTFNVDNLVKRVNITIQNPAPRVFVMSGTTPSPVKVTSNPGASDKFRVSGAGSERIKFYDADEAFADLAALKDLSHHAADANDLFAAERLGVYTIQMPREYEVNPTVAKYSLFGQIKVADLVEGTYSYNIVKKYPDGRVESYSDSVKVTSVDTQGLSVFDSTNTKFLTNWIIAETSYELGRYEFSFTVAGATRNIVIDVVERTQLDITKLSVGTLSTTNLGPSFGLLKKDLIDPADADDLLAATRNVDVAFDLNGLTSANFYKIANVYSTNAALVGAAVNSNFNSLEGVRNIRLGTIATIDTDTANLQVADTVTFEVQYFEKLTYAQAFARTLDKNTTQRYFQVGSTQVIKISAVEYLLSVLAPAQTGTATVAPGTAAGTTKVTFANGAGTYLVKVSDFQVQTPLLGETVTLTQLGASYTSAANITAAVGQYVAIYQIESDAISGFFQTRVTASDLPTVITTAAATRAKPTNGLAQATAAGANPATVSGSAFVHTSTTWSGFEGTANSGSATVWETGETPVAVIVLTAAAGYAFSATIAAANITVDGATISSVTVGSGGSTLTFTVTYPAI